MHPNCSPIFHKGKFRILIGLSCFIILCSSTEIDEIEDTQKRLDPTVFIAILVRNKAHTLPYFFTLLEKLDYPKNRISIWIKSDHNEDETGFILSKWSQKMDFQSDYNSLIVEILDSPPYRQLDQLGSAFNWTDNRFQHIIRLKQEAIRHAKRAWADYIWFLDADVFLVNNQTLKNLIKKELHVVAPMLITGGLYSNFWGGMDSSYYYKRTEEYKKILNRKKIGCFQVPMIHSATLMDLRYVSHPDFLPPKLSTVESEFPVPYDDIIHFAVNAKTKNIPLHICNDLEYGALLSPLDEKGTFELDRANLYNLRAEVAAYSIEPLSVIDELEEWAQSNPEPSKLGFDEVYVINLKRRPDRLTKMKNVLEILGIDFLVVEATDGKELSPERLNELEIEPLPNFRDPHSSRVMTYGEIGCFLSHYRIWNDMLQKHHSTALILEDDIRFEPYFVAQLQRLFQEAGDLKLDWDLIYLGRKRPSGTDEPFVPGSDLIVELGYSYWTLGYAVTSRGVKKLLNADPIKKMVPIDEFLPIMFNRHSNNEWKDAFPVRNLKAFSAEPLLLYPTHYTGEIGYFSDTELSSTITNEFISTIESQEKEKTVGTQERRSHEFSSANSSANHDKIEL